MAGHKLLASSKANVWAGKDGNPGCPASAVLALLCPERESGGAANSGTLAHEIAERILNGENAPLLRDYVAKEVQPHILDTMDTYIKFINDKKASGLKVELEVKLAYSVLIGGTADAIITDEDFMLIECTDMKTGREEVGPESGQIGTYLVAKRKSMGHAGRNYTYVGTIIQGTQIKTRQWTHEELDAWEDKMKNAEQTVVNIMAMGHPAAEYERASDYNCHWCPAKGICHGYAANMFPADTQNKEVVNAIRKAQVPKSKPAILSVAERAEILLAKAGIIKWLDEVEKLSLAEAQSGVEFPGLRIGVKKAGSRNWMNIPESVIAGKLISEGGLTEEQVYTKPGLLTPAQAEKLGVSEDVLKKVCVRSEGKAALVPAKQAIVFED
jgi:hypothetical protein